MLWRSLLQLIHSVDYRFLNTLNILKRKEFSFGRGFAITKEKYVLVLIVEGDENFICAFTDVYNINVSTYKRIKTYARV